MSNVFMEHGHDEIETAILLENAIQTDIGNAVAFTDGNRVFINTDDNLSKVLPDYNKGMLKWLLWHEEYHKQLKHHNRYFKYLDELEDDECRDKLQLTKQEVNIIMDILVHDSLCKMFPELIETARTNLAQMRDCNSLKYTFETVTLEDMLDEYRKHKKEDEDGEGEGSGKGKDGKDEGDSKSDSESDSSGKSEPKREDSKESSGTKAHKEGGGSSKSHDTKEETDSDAEKPEESKAGRHDEVDWNKLEDRDDTEFIDESTGDHYVREIESLKRKKFKLARLTETLNGLATTTKARTYRIPSYIQAGRGIILKGKLPGKTSLYICFDASGSMGDQLAIFKEIISKAIPQAMECPCEWFSGAGEKIPNNPKGRSYDYYKGKFKDIMPVRASSGYDDDGDRTIELCLEAEKNGYSPIGVTDGGGAIYNPEVLKQLKRTILIGQSPNWLEKAKKINPNIQILSI